MYDKNHITLAQNDTRIFMLKTEVQKENTRTITRPACAFIYSNFSLRFHPDVITLNLSASIDSEIAIAQNQLSISYGQVIQLDIDQILDLDMVQCDVMSHMCVFIDQAPATASFRDPWLINNVFCLDVSATKICSPGM